MKTERKQRMQNANEMNKELHTAKQSILNVEPEYPDVHCIGSLFGKHITWEADGWKAIGESYFKSSYIHAGLSGAEETFKGPDAEKLLSDFSINNCSKWKEHKCKHLVSLDKDGYVTNHALFWKDSPTQFRTTAGCSVPYLAAMQTGKYQVEYTTRPIFIFQLKNENRPGRVFDLIFSGLHRCEIRNGAPCGRAELRR